MKAEGCFEQGNQFYEAKDYSAAINSYTRAIALKHRYAHAYNNRGSAYYELRDYTHAIEDYEHAIEFGHSCVSAYHNRRAAYKALEDKNRAIKTHSRAIELNQNDVLAYIKRGDIYNDFGDYTHAIADYTHAIGLNDDSALAYNNRGNAYYNIEEYNHAIKDYTHAIELNQNDVQNTYNNRGLAFYALGDYTHAIEDYTQAIKLSHDSATAYNNRGNAYYDLGDNISAIKDYTLAIDLNQNDANVYNNRGLAYYALGYNNLAIEDYTQAIKIDPNYARVYNNRGKVYNLQQNYKQAIIDFDQALKIRQQYDFYANRGFAYERLRDIVKAGEDYEQAKKLYAEADLLYIEEAKNFEKNLQNNAAIVNYQIALKLNPLNQEVLESITRLEKVPNTKEIANNDEKTPSSSPLQLAPESPPMTYQANSTPAPKPQLSDEKLPEPPSFSSLQEQIEQHKKILQEFSWIERFKDIDAKQLDVIYNDLQTSVDISADVSKIKRKLSEIGKQILPLTIKEQKEEAKLRKIQHILNNDNLRDYYIYFKTLISSTYIGCGAVTSGKVVGESGKTATIGKILGEIASHLPIIGIVSTIITKVADIIDKRSGLSYANKILAILSNNKEMEEISDILAIKMINAKYEELCNVSKDCKQDKFTQYQKKVQFWLDNKIRNLAEQQAEIDVEEIMKIIASEQMPLIKRSKKDIYEHSEEIASIIMDAMGIREVENNLTDIKITLEREEDSVSAVSMISSSSSSSPLSPCSSIHLSSPSMSIDIEEMQRKHETEIAELKAHIAQLKSNHQSMESDRTRLTRLEVEAAKIRKIESELKKKADREDHELDGGGMAQLTMSRGTHSLNSKSAAQIEFENQIRTRLGNMELHLSAVSESVSFMHDKTSGTDLEPKPEAIKAFGLKLRPTSAIKPIFTKQLTHDVAIDAMTIAENSTHRLLEEFRNNTPNPGVLPLKFANSEMQQAFIKFLSEQILTHLESISPGFKQKEQIVKSLSRNLTKFVKKYDEDGLHFIITTGELNSSHSLKLCVNQAVKSVLAKSLGNLK